MVWKVLVAIGALGLLGIVAAFWFLFTYLGGTLSDSSSVAEQVVTAAKADWGEAGFASLAAPEFLAERAKGKFDPTTYQRVFGSIITSESCSTAGLHTANAAGWSQWHCPVTFASGQGRLIVDLILVSGSWRLSGFAVQI